MIAAFLRAEISSSRYGPRVAECLSREGMSRALIDSPDYGSQVENDARARILRMYRGFPDAFLFRRFPEHVDWKRALLERGDVLRVKYLNLPNWTDLSGGSRLAADGARRARAGQQIDGIPRFLFLETVAAIRSGAVLIPPILVASDERAENPVLLDGHQRMTAYLWDPDKIPEELEVIIGLSSEIARWALY